MLKIFKKWIFYPLYSIAALGMVYWIIGKIQYKLNVMDVEEYQPTSTLRIPEHHLRHSKFPFIDVHNHQWSMPVQNLASLVSDMDSLNMAVMINLSGYRGKYLSLALKNVNENYPNRFGVFMNINFEDIDDEGWPEATLTLMDDAVKQGVKGLKVYKSLGLTDKDNNGNRITVDDPRLDPIWKKCAELGIPVLIHTGEPSSFWKPKDRYNERWLELKQEPDRYKSPEEYPSFDEVMAEQHRMFKKHPNTKFIDAHLGWYGNDLEKFGLLLDTLPNVYTELGAVLAELGRQPRFARAWMIKYQDRVMMGKDSYKKEEYYTYFRVLETEDEYFDYYRKRHAHWKMYGLGLPDSVLRKIYYKNALRVIPGLDKKLFEK